MYVCMYVCVYIYIYIYIYRTCKQTVHNLTNNILLLLLLLRYGRGSGHQAIYSIPYKIVAPATRIENRPPECCVFHTKPMSV